MKKQNIIAAVLALAGLSLASPSAFAQVSPLHGGSQQPNYNDGDLLLGFVQYNPGTNTETSKAYVLDIGSAANYEPGGAFYSPGTTFDLNLGTTADLGNVNSDLNAAYGSSWATATGPGVYFSVAGYLNDVTNVPGSTNTDGTLWTTNPSSTSYTRGSKSGQDNVGGNIASIGNGFGASTTNSDVGFNSTGQTSATYNYYEPGGNFSSQTTSFNTNWSGATGNESLVSSTLYLDLLAPGSGSGTTLGTFTVLSTGEVDFEAIPEPSTYASLGLGVLVLVAWRMKRRGTMLPA